MRLGRIAVVAKKPLRLQGPWRGCPMRFPCTPRSWTGRSSGPRFLDRPTYVQDLRRRLRDLEEPTFGTKCQMWRRLKEAEIRKAEVQDLDRVLRHDAEGVGGPAALRERYGLMHLPPAPWCEHCVRGRGAEAPHRRRPALGGVQAAFVGVGILAPRHVKRAGGR